MVSLKQAFLFIALFVAISEYQYSKKKKEREIEKRRKRGEEKSLRFFGEVMPKTSSTHRIRPPVMKTRRNFHLIGD
ncbi:hypothetical protein P3L10_014151 [Capsicum annuum]